MDQPFNPRLMSQFTIQPINNDILNEEWLINYGIEQVSQIITSDDQHMDIMYETHTNRIIVQIDDTCFYITSTDIPDPTVRQVINWLGYEDNQIVVIWADQINDQLDNILDETVQQVPLNQISLYQSNDMTTHYSIPHYVSTYIAG